MKLAYGSRTGAMSAGFVSLVLGALALAAAPSFAAPPAVESAPKYAGHIIVNVATGATTRVYAPAAAGDVYANTTTVTAGLSSTDLLAVWGDRVTTLGTGVLDQLDFPVFNSASSAGPLLTALITVTFYDGTLALLPPPIGNLSTSVDFGAGLGPGFYTIVSLTGLTPQAINLTTTDLLVTQTVTSFTGTATRLGTIFADPPTVGSSLLPAANTCYVNATTIGAAGYYSFPAPNGNLAYRINIPGAPVELSRFTAE